MSQGECGITISRFSFNMRPTFSFDHVLHTDRRKQISLKAFQRVFGRKNRRRYSRCDAMRIPDCLQEIEGAGSGPPFPMNENGETEK